MSAKRPTKAEKKQAEIAALERRLVDLAQGAVGWPTFSDGQDESSPGLAHDMGIPEWLRFVSAVKRTFLDPEKPESGYAFELWNLDKFADRFDVLALHLYNYGVGP